MTIQSTKDHLRATWPVDALLVAYLSVSALVMIRLGTATPNILTLHAAGCLVIAGARIALDRQARGASPLGGLLQMVHLNYPVVMAMLLYLELDRLLPLAGGHLYDNVVQGWEQALFGESPALWLSRRLPSLLLSEYLHFCYLAYYLLILTLLIPLLRRGRWWEAQTLQLVTAATYLTGFVCFSVFPVEGPRLVYPPLDESIRGPLWALCHYLAGQGAAAAAAFPSGHVALATVLLILSWRWQRSVFWAVLPVAGGLILATVYGRFHYAVDALAGMALAAVMVALGSAVQGRVTSACPTPGANPE